MNKVAIKTFAMWARIQLIQDVSTKAMYFGISENGFVKVNTVGDVIMLESGGTKAIILSTKEAAARNKLIDKIKELAKSSSIKQAYQSVVEEIAYTWFNRIVAIRFMEVNGYLPSRVKVLCSDTEGKNEPDIITKPQDAELNLSSKDNDYIYGLKINNKQDELFKFLFIKQCNALGEYLPELFEAMDDYTEMLIDLKYTDSDGVVRKIVTDIDEQDFKDAVEIIGWMYQYYNQARKEEVINIYKGVVAKEDIPAATQLFTTDWIVRYMIENSLGKKYIEHLYSTGNSERVVKLKQKWKYYIDEQETTPYNLPPTTYNLQPNFDIKDIKVIDPCMGSGHILVYAFEVLMDIYKDLGYSEKEIPALILSNNLYGLDIDKRAYQLAYFAVMMMARKYDRKIFSRIGLVPHIYDIEESNSINRNHLKYFGEGMPPKLRKETELELNSLLDQLNDAKEYGSIINIDENLNWENLYLYVGNVFISTQQNIDTIGIEQTQEKLKKLIFIGATLAQKYDVVCTNPPYLNKYNEKLKSYVNENYKDYSGDLFSVFIYRNLEMCKVNGYSAYMSPFVWMFIKTYEKLRRYIISNKSISSLIQMEYSAFEEAIVPLCTFVLQNEKINKKGQYIKLSDFKGGMEVQRVKVLESLKNNSCNYRFECSTENFSKIPGSPIAYWVSEKMLRIFEKSTLLSDIAEPKQGIATADNNRFLREWYEVLNRKINFNATDNKAAIESTKKWFPYNKGGEFRKWYGNNDYVVNWENGGSELKNFKNSVLRNPTYYFKECFSWSLISSSVVAFRYKPNGHLFDVAGMSLFAKESDRKYLFGLCNTPIIHSVMKALAPTINFQVGNIANIPVILNEEKKFEIDQFVEENISISKTDWDSFETSWDFLKHPLVKGVYKRAIDNDLVEKYIEVSYMKWETECNERFNTLKANEEELNRIFIEIYGLQDELTSEVEDKDITVRKANLQREIKSLIGYAVGCMFGRYSPYKEGLIYAGGEWNYDSYKNMFLENKSIPDNFSGQLFLPRIKNVIPITDEDYINDDIVNNFILFIEIIYGAETLEENLDFIAKALGGKGETPRHIIRSYFVNDFYKDHCKIYKKRPIYWQLDSGNNDGLKALIYLHRYNEDTMGIARTDYLHKIQRIYEGEVGHLDDIIETCGNPRDVVAARRRKDKIIKQIQETRDYDMVLGHIAMQRISLDLDDGVVVNYAKFQDIEVSAGEGKKPVKMNILTKLG